MSGGFPHSDIHRSKPIPGSPWLNAGYHVLHRLLLPRHPPNALFALDLIQKEQNHWFVGFLFGPKAVLSHASSFEVAVSVLDLEQYRSWSCDQECIALTLSKRYRCFSLYDVNCLIAQAIRLDDQTHLMCLMIKSILPKEWWVRMDSNHRPYAYQAYALTT